MANWHRVFGTAFSALWPEPKNPEKPLMAKVSSENSM
jgi:hypothetical protein